MRYGWLPCLLVAVGCSNLDEVEGGVVAVEVSAPAFAVLEVNETLQLLARSLDRDGNVVDAAVTWRSADATLSVDPTSGVITGLAPGPGRVQATVGSLSSALLTFTVLAPADTLIITGDSLLTVPADQTTSAPLSVTLQSFSPPGPVDQRPVIFTVTRPDPLAAPPGVLLPNGLTEDTVLTASDGTITVVTLSRVAGVVSPDTAVVVVTATRTRGAPVPGSGQRFIVAFQ